MNQNSNVINRRGRFQGVWQIFCYNWPWFVGSAAFKLLTLVVITLLPMPFVLKALLLTAASLAILGATLSLVASHWIYDRSEINRWTWVKRCLPAAPAAWTNIHAGLDESSEPLSDLYGHTARQVLDIYDPTTMTEPAIKRARASHAVTIPCVKAKADCLPLSSDSQDCIFMIFAAHEVRDPVERDQLFAEAARALAPGGRLVLVEHLRDLANAVAFGPGCFHFLPKQEWLRVTVKAGLSLVSEEKITPFVSVFVFEK